MAIYIKRQQEMIEAAENASRLATDVSIIDEEGSCDTASQPGPSGTQVSQPVSNVRQYSPPAPSGRKDPSHVSQNFLHSPTNRHATITPGSKQGLGCPPGPTTTTGTRSKHPPPGPLMFAVNGSQPDPIEVPFCSSSISRGTSR